MAASEGRLVDSGTVKAVKLRCKALERRGRETVPPRRPPEMNIATQRRRRAVPAINISGDVLLALTSTTHLRAPPPSFSDQVGKRIRGEVTILPPAMNLLKTCEHHHVRVTSPGYLFRCIVFARDARHFGQDVGDGGDCEGARDVPAREMRVRVLRKALMCSKVWHI